ncbi:MAG TPA: aspartate/glutamate racemase family protein [bacterium]|jgi:Asp/Glu/hydantoin racemase|nr:aspartate/glutamate racemase family protein [bacterium]
MQTIGVIHTGPVTVEPLKRLFPEYLPQARIVNLVDDSLLSDVRRAGSLTPEVVQRYVQYAIVLDHMRCDAIFNACSSVGEAVAVAQSIVRAPIVKVDQAMAERAIDLGERIAVVATVESTLNPTARLIEAVAAAAGKPVTVERQLCDTAFEYLLKGDAKTHDAIVMAGIEEAASHADVVVLAQVSMARLVEEVGIKFRVPVLTSPRLGVMRLAQILQSIEPVPA